MNLFLYSTGYVAPRATADESGRHLADEPDYTGLIPPMQLRRMTKGVRMGIAAAGKALAGAGIAKPDAISIGTAMGMLADTETFLSKMVAQNEALLTPTAFIQSTHNTVSGQIALGLGCTGHNMTYVQRGMSFEHAMIGADLYLMEHPGRTVLVGGLDELTPTSHALLKAGGAYRETGGEGAAFFVAGDTPQEGSWQVQGLKTFSGIAAEGLLSEFFKTQPASQDAALVLTNMDESEGLQRELREMFKNAALRFWTGETGCYATASAHALTAIFDSSFTGSSAVLINRYGKDTAAWWLQRVKA